MNWIMATSETLEKYSISTAGQRQLSNDEFIIHFETSDPHWVVMKDDSRVTYWTHDALTTYLEFVEGEL